MLNRIFLTLAIVSSLQFFLTSPSTVPHQTRSTLSENPVNLILTSER